jgi:hypothetical protein
MISGRNTYYHVFFEAMEAIFALAISFRQLTQNFFLTVGRIDSVPARQVR